MKKIICLFSLLCLALLYFNQNVLANEKLNDKFELISSETIYFDDGTYIVNEVLEERLEVVFYNNSYSKSGIRNVTKYDGNNVVWNYKLSANYMIEEGISSSCINSSYSTDIYYSGWSFGDGETYYFENVAYGVGTFYYKVLFITINTEKIDITLSCDCYGNLS